MIGYFVDQNLNLFEKFNEIDAVINVLCDIVQHRLGCSQTQYNFKFFSCACELTKSQKNKVFRNQEQFNADKVKRRNKDY